MSRSLFRHDVFRMTSAATVLVIDDEPQIRRLLNGTLSRAGYRVIEAS